MIINVNGKICDETNATISVMDRGFLYGDGIYETMLAINGRVLFLDHHLARLRESAQGLMIPVPLTDKEWKVEIEKGVVASLSLSPSGTVPNLVVRLVLTRGEGPLTLGITPNLTPNWVIWTRSHTPLPSECYEKGVGLTMSKIVRNDPRSLDPKLKTANFLNNLLALMDAQKASTHEAIMLNAAGFVAEGATSNIWMVKKGVLITPPLSAGILSGITRSIVLEVAQFHQVDVIEELFTATELFDADECFITSSTRGLLPVATIDSKVIGSDRSEKKFEITSKLSCWYQERIEEYAREDI